MPNWATGLDQNALFSLTGPLNGRAFFFFFLIAFFFFFLLSFLSLCLFLFVCSFVVVYFFIVHFILWSLFGPGAAPPNYGVRVLWTYYLSAGYITPQRKKPWTLQRRTRCISLGGFFFDVSFLFHFLFLFLFLFVRSPASQTQLGRIFIIFSVSNICAHMHRSIRVAACLLKFCSGSPGSLNFQFSFFCIFNLFIHLFIF